VGEREGMMRLNGFMSANSGLGLSREGGGLCSSWISEKRMSYVWMKGMGWEEFFCIGFF